VCRPSEKFKIELKELIAAKMDIKNMAIHFTFNGGYEIEGSTKADTFDGRIVGYKIKKDEFYIFAEVFSMEFKEGRMPPKAIVNIQLNPRLNTQKIGDQLFENGIIMDIDKPSFGYADVVIT
jgi:hypothetical protein